MPRRRDERGGAISLWVLLMVPVSAFAAVAAMAGPQRLAAESTMQEAADDMAAFAVAWRDGQNTPSGALLAFFPECEMLTEAEHTDLERLRTEIGALDPLTPNPPEVQRLSIELDPLFPAATLQTPPVPAANEDELQGRFADLDGWIQASTDGCRTVLETLLRDLGHLGVDAGTVRGFYSDSLTASILWDRVCSDPIHPDQAACEAAGEDWEPQPCQTSEATAVHDAVHVALAADWQDAGWAAAQVWPDGMRIAAESMGRLSQLDVLAPTLPPCGDRLIVLDSEGRPAWAGNDPSPASRDLSQLVRRTTLSG